MTYAIMILVGLAALAGVARLFVGYGPSHLEGALMSPREQAIVATFADAFFPPSGPLAVSGQEAGVTRYFDDYLKRSARTQRFLIRLLILYIELEPLVFGPRASRFSRLTQTERVMALESTSTSSIYFRRVSFISLRALMTMAYLASEQVTRAMHLEQRADPFGLGDRVLEDTPTNRSEHHP